MKSIQLFAAAASTTVLFACIAPAVAPDLATRVQLLSGVPPYLTVDSCELRRDSGVPLFIGEIRNTSRVAKCSLMWQVEFRNDAGVQVAASDSRWASVSIGPGESKQLQLVASSPSAVDFRFKLRPK